MSIKMKSVFGIAALEELQQEQTETTETTETTEAEVNAEGGEAAADTGEKTEVTVEEKTEDQTTTTEEVAPAEDAGETKEVTTEADDAAQAAIDNVEAAGDELPVGEDVEGGDTAELIAEETSEAEEAGETAEAIVDDMQKLQSASEALTQTLDVLHASQQSGGLNAPGAMLLRQNLAFAMESIDQPADAILLPALEDAETPSSRVGMAGDAIAAIKKFLARIGKAIADGFKKFAEWVAKMVTRLTDATVRLEERAEKIKAIAKNAEFNETVTSRSVIKGISFSGTVPNDITKNVLESLDIARKIATPDTYAGYLEALSVLEKAAKDLPGEAVVTEGVNKALAKMSAKFEQFTSNKTLAKVEDKGGKRVATFKLPGNREVTLNLAATIDAIHASTDDAYRTVPLSGVSEKSIPAASKADTIKLCDAVIETAKWMRESKSSNRESMQKFAEEVKKNSEAITKYLETSIETRGGELGQADQSVSRKIGSFVIRMTTATPRLPIYAALRMLPGAMGGTLDFAAASIKKQGEAKSTDLVVA